MANKKASFTVGELVTWKSQAAGSWKTKVGTVIEVVAPKRFPKTLHHYGTRDHESYVVLVFPKTKTGVSKKPEKYWPIANKLRRSKAR